MTAIPPSARQRILIVEDHEGLGALLAEEVEGMGLQVRTVTNAEHALPLCDRWNPDLIVSDLRLPGADGLDLLQAVKRRSPPPGFLIITAFGTVAQAVEALKAGADDFLTKPLDLAHFKHRLERLLDIQRLQREVEGLRKALPSETFHGMYGNSPPMQSLFGQIKQIAMAQGPVLILGESGTGKELVARAIHTLSERRDAPFLAVNCAGIPESLMESECFGHEAGAFTGARQARKGLFREAQGGTLLLDEIAEMPLALQSKLLRILQDGHVRPVGSNHEFQVDVRILAATHQNIDRAVSEHRFREDLYYRLETFSLRIPPLRERERDIEMLAHRFLNYFAGRMGKSIDGFAEETLQRIVAYRYPGNVRELQNAIERAVVFCNHRRVLPEHLPARMRADVPPKLLEGQGFALDVSDDALPSLDALNQQYLHYVLAKVGGNKKRAADILGITRKTLYQRLSR